MINFCLGLVLLSVSVHKVISNALDAPENLCPVIVDGGGEIMSPGKPSGQFKISPDTLGVDVDEILSESGSLNLLGKSVLDRPLGDLIDRNEIHNCIKI